MTAGGTFVLLITITSCVGDHTRGKEIPSKLSHWDWDKTPFFFFLAHRAIPKPKCPKLISCASGLWYDIKSVG